MRVATAAEMARVDSQAIAAGTPGAQLMERAGREIVRALLDLFPALAPPGRVAICCGKGNNGGDGLVMARLLDSLGFQVTVLLLGLPEDMAPDARLNHGRLPSAVRVVAAPAGEWAARWREVAGAAELAVDAVLGTGIRTPVRAPYAELLAAFQGLRAPVLSVDVPSGVDADNGRVDPVAVRASATVTVGLPKLGLLLPPGRDHVGELAVVDIGLPPAAVEELVPDRRLLLPDDYAALLPARASDLHKYRCGTVLVVGGSRAYGGAAVLAGMGALRSGAGLVTVALPETLASPARTALPEAIVRPLPMTASGTLAPWPPAVAAEMLRKQHAVAIGPGMGEDPETDRWVLELLDALELPAVVDADALTAHARLGKTPAGRGRLVLTPHAGELARLLGTHASEIERRRLELAPELAERWGVTLLLKGSPTVIAAPGGGVHINPTGDDALAHGGTGDVLAGLIGGLLAQGCGPLAAALLGAYLHGRAGRIAADEGSRRSVLAREVAAALGGAFAELERRRAPDGGG